MKKRILKFPCIKHNGYIPDQCKDCEQGVTEELDNMIKNIEESLKK